MIVAKCWGHHLYRNFYLINRINTIFFCGLWIQMHWKDEKFRLICFKGGFLIMILSNILNFYFFIIFLLKLEKEE